MCLHTIWDGFEVIFGSVPDPASYKSGTVQSEIHGVQSHAGTRCDMGLFLLSLAFLSAFLPYSRSAWSLESSPQQPFAFDCPPGEAMNGITIRSLQSSGDAPRIVANSQLWSDFLCRVYCSPFLNSSNPKNIGQPQAPLPPARIAQEFSLAQGSDIKDSNKNCANDEYICGLAGPFVNNQRL